MAYQRDYKFTAREIAQHICLDCKRNVIRIGDYCMISNEIWTKKLGLGRHDTMCISCVESRLGRALTPEEVGFGLTPAVEGYPKSDLLLTRAGFGAAVRKRGKKVARKKTGARS